MSNDPTDEDIEAYIRSLSPEKRLALGTIKDKVDREEKEAEELAKMRDKAERAVFLVTLFRMAFLELKDHSIPDVFSSTFSEIKPQSLPREAIIGRKYGLSETEVHNLREKAKLAAKG